MDLKRPSKVARKSVKNRHWHILKNEQNVAALDYALVPPDQKEWQDGFYPYIQRHILSKLGHVRTSIDVGANYGWMANIFNSFSERVECFEPREDVYNCLVKNIDKNKWKATAHNIGLSDVTGIDFHDNNEITGNTKLGAENGIQCEVTTLDSFGFKDVDILKIDAEGYENKILSGSYNTILDNRPVCIVEMGDEFLKRNPYLEDHRQTFFRHFVNLEYNLFDLRTRDYIFFPIEMR